MIVIIDSFGGYQFPNSKALENKYLSEEENIIDLLTSYVSGVYLMSILEHEQFEGQMGDFGRWEVEPYSIVSKIKMTKIGDVFCDFKTKLTIKKEKEELLIKKTEDLQKWVESFSNEKDDYVLYSPWGVDLCFAKKAKNCSTFLSTSTIQTYKTTLSEENIDFIKEDIQIYFDNGCKYTDNKK